MTSEKRIQKVGNTNCDFTWLSSL